jgi:Spx/MgsR family transcriptional regulator
VSKPRFIHKKTCSTCRKARAFLVERFGADRFEERELNAAPLTEAELSALIGDRDHKPFLNFRNELYRQRNMKKQPPDRKEAVKLMAREPNLIRRPLLVAGREIVFGFDEPAFAALMKG